MVDGPPWRAAADLRQPDRGTRRGRSRDGGGLTRAGHGEPGGDDLMADELLFHSWKRSTAARGASLVDGRLRGQLDLTLSELVQPGRGPQTRSLHYHMMGPADMARLRPGAVTSVYPAPGAVGVETTKSPYAELAESDLPWRYSLDPLPALEEGMKPWLVLVVGTTEELWQVGGGKLTFTTAVANELPLAQ